MPKAKPIKKAKPAVKAKSAKPAMKSKTMIKAKPAAKSKKIVLAKKPSKQKAVSKAPIKKKVMAIPKGYNSVTPYLIMDGAAKAIEFYKKAFGAKEALRMEKPDKRIAHAELKIGDTLIMLADACHEMNANSPKTLGGSPISMHLYVKNVDKVIDNAVAAGAKISRPIENMFWGDRCGLIEDPQGYKWNVSTHIENVSSRELKKRAAQLFENN